MLALATLTIGARPRWPLAAVQCGLFAIAIVWTSAVALGRTPWRGSGWLAALALIPLWGIAQLFAGRTVYDADTVVSILHWTALFAIFAVGVHAFDETGRGVFLRLLLSFGAAAAVMVLLSPYLPVEIASKVFPAEQDFHGPFQNRNNYAAFALLVIPVAAWHGLDARGRSWAGWAAAALLYATVIGSGSRAGAVLATIEAVAILAAARLRGVSRKRLAAGALSFAALGAAFTAVAGWELLWERLHFSDPLEYRREIYRATLAMIADQPWTGFGLGTFATVYPRFAVFDSGLFVNYAHNDWLQWAAEGGLGMAALTAALVAALAPRAVRSVWGLGVLFVALHALVDFPMQRLGVAGWAVALGAALAACETPSRRAYRQASRPAPHEKLPAQHQGQVHQRLAAE